MKSSHSHSHNAPAIRREIRPQRNSILKVLIFPLVLVLVAIGVWHEYKMPTADVVAPNAGVGREERNYEEVEMYLGSHFVFFNQLNKVEEEEEKPIPESIKFDPEAVESYGWVESEPFTYVDENGQKQQAEAQELFEIVFKKDDDDSKNMQVKTLQTFTASASSSSQAVTDTMPEEESQKTAAPEVKQDPIPVEKPYIEPAEPEESTPVAEEEEGEIDWTLRTFNTDDPERLTHYSRVPNFGGTEEPSIYWDDTENKVLYFSDGTFAPYKECITIKNVTSYCPCPICCHEWSGCGCTRSEHCFEWNDQFVAADINYLSWFVGRNIDYGTHIYLEDGFYSIEDSGVPGSWIDVWNPTHWGALQHGMNNDVPMYIFD